MLTFHFIGNSSDLLSQIQLVSSNVKAVMHMELVSFLESSKFCEGNNDNKFTDLMHNKGTLKDQYCKLVSVLTVWMSTALLGHVYFQNFFSGSTVTAYLDTTSLQRPTV